MVNVQPITNMPNPYANGFKLIWVSNTTIQVTGGRCRDSTNTCDIINDNALTTLTNTYVGINGVYNAAVAQDTWYAVYVIGSSMSKVPTAYIMSASPTPGSIPVLPPGYDIYYRIGWVRTGSGNTNFIKFYQMGSNGFRVYQWDSPISIFLSGNSSAGFSSWSLLPGSPPINATDISAYRIYISILAAGNDTYSFSVRPTGGTAAAGITSPMYYRLNDDGPAALSTYVLGVGINGSSQPAIEYQVSAGAALSFYVVGFEDYV